MKKTLIASSLLGIWVAGAGCDRKVNPYTDEGYAPSPERETTEGERQEPSPMPPQENP